MQKLNYRWNRQKPSLQEIKRTTKNLPHCEENCVIDSSNAFKRGRVNTNASKKRYGRSLPACASSNVTLFPSSSSSCSKTALFSSRFPSFSVSYSAHAQKKEETAIATTHKNKFNSKSRKTNKKTQNHIAEHEKVQKSEGEKLNKNSKSRNNISDNNKSFISNVPWLLPRRNTAG